MAEVPYVPVSQVKNTDASGAMISVPNATARAFGEGVGIAMQRVGAAGQQMADAVAHQTLEFQKIQNETAANNILLAGAEKIAQEELKLKQLDGENAVNYLPTYNENVKKIRESIVGGSDNSEVARLVDTALRRRATDAIISGAGYAGGQARVAREASRNGLIATSQTEAAQAGELEFERSVQTIEKIATEQAEEKFGKGNPGVQAYVQQQLSEAYQKRTETLAMSDPERAKKFMEDNRTKFTADGLQRGLETINRSAVTVGSRNIALRTMPVLGNMGPAAGAIKAIESGNKYDSEGEWITKKNGTRDQAIGAYQVMRSNIPSWTKEVLGVSMTAEEFKANKAAQDRVFQVKFKQAYDKYGTIEDAVSVWFTGRPYAQAVREGALDVNITVQEYVARFQRAMGTAGIGSDLAAPSTISAEETSQWVKRAREEAQKQFPDNPTVADQAEARVLQAAGRQNSLSDKYRTQQLQSVMDAAMGTGRDKPPTHLEELFGGNKDLSAAYYALNPEQRQQINKVLIENARGKVRTWTPEAIQEEARIRGMAEDNPEEFKKLVIPALPLPKDGIDKLVQLQKEMIGGKSRDGSVTQAMNVVKSTGFMEQMDIDPKTDPERYQTFLGVLEHAMESWRLQNPRHQGPIPQDAIVKMLPALAKEVPQSRRGAAKVLDAITDPPTKPAFEANPDQAVKDAVSGTRTMDQILMDSGVPGQVLQPLRQLFFQRNGRAPRMDELRQMYFSSPSILKKFPPTKEIPGFTPRRDSMLEGGGGQAVAQGDSGEDTIETPQRYGNEAGVDFAGARGFLRKGGDGSSRQKVTKRESLEKPSDNVFAEFDRIGTALDKMANESPTDDHLSFAEDFKRAVELYRKAPTESRKRRMEALLDEAEEMLDNEAGR